jgi:hypothetical protein
MLKIVTCPEAGTLELVECVETQLGHLIHRCTRFRPVCAMKCTRGCAVSLDRASEEEVGPREGHPTLELEVEPEPVS